MKTKNLKSVGRCRICNHYGLGLILKKVILLVRGIKIYTRRFMFIVNKLRREFMANKRESKIGIFGKLVLKVIKPYLKQILKDLLVPMITDAVTKGAGRMNDRIEKGVDAFIEEHL
jgi:hypothetical protein